MLFLPTQLPSDSDFLDYNHLLRIPTLNIFQTIFALNVSNFSTDCFSKTLAYRKMPFELLNCIRIQLSLQKMLRSYATQ